MTFDHEGTETAVSTQAAESTVFAATEPAPDAAANQRDAPEPHSEEPERLPRPGEVAEPAAIGPALTPDGEELDSIEFAGRSFKVPKALKPGFMMQADYTRKTQDVAAKGPALQEQQRLLQEQAAHTADHLVEVARLIALDERLTGHFEAIDWETWLRQDPAAAADGWRDYEQTKAGHAAQAAKLAHAIADKTERERQDTARRFEDTRAFAKRSITGWNDELDARLADFATRELGFTDAEIERHISPKTYAAVHRAWLAAEMQKQPKSASSAATANPAAAPLETVASRSSPGGRRSLADMSMDEYVAERKRQAG